jgi:hypothetical protein
MLIRTELDNPNCEWVDGRVFQEQGTPRPVRQALRRRGDKEVWCDVVGLETDAREIPAMALRVEDSGEGICWLVFGGAWGLRLRHGSDVWGEAYLLLPSDGADLKF